MYDDPARRPPREPEAAGGQCDGWSATRHRGTRAPAPADLSPVSGDRRGLPVRLGLARETAWEGSDLDLGLLLDRNEPEDPRHRFLGDLAAQLQAVAAARPIDLVVLNAQGPVFCHQVMLDGRLIYESNRERRIDFESDTIVRALDFRPTLEIATRGYLPGFRRWLRDYRDRQRHPAPA